MKNSENLGLVELNAQEVVSIEGGGWPEWFASQIADHWEEIKKGFNDGFNAGNK